MCYIIYQSEGLLNDYANEYTQIRLNDGLAAARRFYSNITGKPVDSLPSLESVWWIYNASDSIRRDYKFTPGEYNQLFNQYPYDNEASAIARCQLAARKHGGKWSYYYEP